MKTKNKLELRPHTIVVVPSEISRTNRELLREAFGPLNKIRGYRINEKDIGDNLYLRANTPYLPSLLSLNIKNSILNEIRTHATYPSANPFILVELEKDSGDIIEDIKNVACELHYNVEFLEADFIGGIILDEEKLFNAKALTDLQKQYALGWEISEKSKSFIFGDIHGCFHTFKAALEKIFDAEIPNESSIIKSPYSDRVVLLAGDVVDKGFFGKEVIKLCLNNKDKIKWVLGNHEQFINSSLQNRHGEVKGLAPEITKVYFTSLTQYENDEEFKDLLDEYVKLSYPFIETKTFIITHAPCEQKYLGKLDKLSIRSQRNILIKSDATKDDTESLLGFLLKESDDSLPYHFFGHVATKEAFVVKNKISLDTSAVCGNKLTYCVINNNEQSVSGLLDEITHEKDLQSGVFKKIEPFYTLFDGIEVESTSECLSTKSMPEHKVTNIIAPEISFPLYGEDLSVNLSRCLGFYEKHGISMLRIQPGFLSNKVTVYLHKMLSDCYMTDSSGNKISELHKRKGNITNLRRFFQIIKETLPKNVYTIETVNKNCLVIEGTLLPWSVTNEKDFLNLVDGIEKLPKYKMHKKLLKEKDKISNAEFIPEKLVRVVYSDGSEARPNLPLNNSLFIVGNDSGKFLDFNYKFPTPSAGKNFDCLLVEPWGYSNTELARKSAIPSITIYKDLVTKDLADQYYRKGVGNPVNDKNVRASIKLAEINRALLVIPYKDLDNSNTNYRELLTKALYYQNQLLN